MANTRRKVGRPKATPPPSPTRGATAKAAKAASSPKKALKEAPVHVLTSTSKTPSPDTKSPARGSQMGATSHTVQTAENPNDQKELTTTMERGKGSRNGSIGLRCLHSLDKKTNDHSAVIAVIRNYVTQHFFPDVKFITSNRKLAYYDAKAHPNTYCSVITKGCNLPPNTDLINWWESVAKREVRKKFINCGRMD
jgi:hypothetical protein